MTDENGTVFGVICEDANGNEVTFTGSSIVLCTGGFGQNSELLAEVRPDLANAITDEVAPTTGDGLQATIDQWNADCNAGADSQFGRESNLNKLEGTLYGYNFGIGAHYFMGGILINEYTQVVDTNGDAIEGLYAAGEVTGGFYDNFRVDGSGPADAFVFGRLTGKYAAANALK